MGDGRGTETKVTFLGETDEAKSHCSQTTQIFLTPCHNDLLHKQDGCFYPNRNIIPIHKSIPEHFFAVPSCQKTKADNSSSTRLSLCTSGSAVLQILTNTHLCIQILKTKQCKNVFLNFDPQLTASHGLLCSHLKPTSTLTYSKYIS